MARRGEKTGQGEGREGGGNTRRGRREDGEEEVWEMEDFREGRKTHRKTGRGETTRGCRWVRGHGCENDKDYGHTKDWTGLER